MKITLKNFTLDGNPSGIEVGPNSGLSFTNSSGLSRLKLDFEKVLKMVENVGGEYIKVENNSQLDGQNNVKFIKNHERKFGKKPD